MLFLAAVDFATPTIAAAATNVGPKACSKCHAAEEEVWYHTKHRSSYKTLHKKKLAAKLIAAVGGDERPKRNEACVACHYSLIARAGRRRARPRAGPACESCHGPAADWVETHYRLGAFKNSKEESDTHRDKRLRRAEGAGMIHSAMQYELAETCMRCHGLANSKLPTWLQEKLVANKHPVARSFELVRYSQGSVRHRYYPPDFKVNQELSVAELARLMAIGAAAQYVSAHQALNQAKSDEYKKLQQHRANAAAKILRKVDLPAATKLLDSPSRSDAKALVKALQRVDLSAKLQSLLPTKSSYK